MNEHVIVKPGTNLEVKLNSDLVASKISVIDEKFMELVYANNPEYFQIDMIDVEMVDSSGISLLLAMHGYLKEIGCSLKIVNLSDDIFDLFIRMRINQHIEINKKS